MSKIEIEDVGTIEANLIAFFKTNTTKRFDVGINIIEFTAENKSIQNEEEIDSEEFFESDFDNSFNAFETNQEKITSTQFKDKS